MSLELEKLLENLAEAPLPKKILHLPGAESAVFSGKLKGEADGIFGKPIDPPVDNPDPVMRSLEIDAYRKAYNKANPLRRP